MRLIDPIKLKQSIAVSNIIGDGKTLEELIDEQPDALPEIIRCKECKHSEHWYKDKRRCFLWAEDGIDVFEDGYCNYAEGKEE